MHRGRRGLWSFERLTAYSPSGAPRGCAPLDRQRYESLVSIRCLLETPISVLLRAITQEVKVQRAIASVLFSLALVVPAAAETTKGGYPACLTKDLFEQYTSAMIKKDYDTIGYLMENGCLIPKAGIRILVLDRRSSGEAKIRAYVGNDAVVLWTNVENIAQ